ncbi:hypothetical protein BDW59DRAFT_152557 [Aspergillus cavernicola]|uniref:SigF-like NTF2-like domain-containing protein n=1 Tax=Aspergillus cavernicola TaxID=176166 RepID=A0ABR4HRW7_9EURO
MENPVAEAPNVIRLLTQSSPSLQEETIDQFFTTNAEFVHPFCRIWSYSGSRWGVKKIYQWYKIMSPHIDLEIRSVAYDKQNLKLYVTIFQIFSIWLIPFYSAPVTLTTVLDLTTDQNPGARKGTVSSPGVVEKKRYYYIQKQEDLYQPSEFIKFVLPFGVGHWMVMMCHAFASVFSILGVFALWPIMWAEERGYFDYFYETRKGAREGVVDALNNHIPDMKRS